MEQLLQSFVIICLYNNSICQYSGTCSGQKKKKDQELSIISAEFSFVIKDLFKNWRRQRRNEVPS
jgi:hypothetical protein